MTDYGCYLSNTGTLAIVHLASLMPAQIASKNIMSPPILILWSELILTTFIKGFLVAGDVITVAHYTTHQMITNLGTVCSVSMICAMSACIS